MKEVIVSFIRKFSLRDYYRSERKTKKLTARQFELLDLLLDNPVTFTLKDLHDSKTFLTLYGKASTQTARRDLKKLAAQGLLLGDENNKYTLNFRVLG